MKKHGWLLPLCALALSLSVSVEAQAFCGFYVGGAGAELFNNATMVVMMREGTTTVLSMQNNYQGPPSDFAMVVPVPVVLQKENVKTLPRDVFDHVDRLAAPRLVEYWEQDPCAIEPPRMMAAPSGVRRRPSVSKSSSGRDGVVVEAQFEVGEYEVVILSAADSSGLDRWLRAERYNIPQGAEPVLRPYVQQGMKFFVAKVNAQKVTFAKGMAELSPLRFHYDSESFELPVRLGLLNAHGKQDLIVHILSKGKRYEVANYDNVTIPTNIDVSEATKSRFGAFYASLFDEVVAKHPRSVITEYAWQATSCDPCPGPPLGGKDFMTLGGDVLAPMPDDQPFPSGPPRRPGRGRMWGGGSQYVLTRLHARYDRNALNEDLVFREAPPIVGGREFLQEGGKLERGATPSSVNNFQGRYIIRHPWTGPITCAQPRRGRWGGPPGGAQPPTMPAQKLAFAPRGVALASFTEANPTADGMSLLSKGTPLGNTTPLPPAPEPDTTPAATGTASEPAPGDATSVPATPPSSGGCGGCSVGSADDARDFAWGALLALGLATWRRRRR